jgi:2-C-methyl-D-erythritol 4-phosphate cytidylyltransferase
MTNIAVIFAGGTGQRMKAKEDSLPKQFLKINEKPIIIHTLELFERHPDIDKIYIAIHPDYYDYMHDLVKHYYITKTAGIVNGGATGQDSIYRALKAAEAENGADSIVLIHDGVRPHITSQVISNAIEGAKRNGNAITCTSCFETILISEDGVVPSTVPPRKNTYTGQAPQAFHLGEIVAAHETIRKTNPNYEDIVDSCMLFRTLGKKTYLVPGNRGNIKITTVEDLYLLRALIRYKEDAEVFGEK